MRGAGFGTAAVVAGIALVLRLPFASGVLWAWDSVLYARAIDDFHLGTDALDQRPHPPGYVLYVLLARAAAGIFGDPNLGLVALSALAGALACGVAVLLARRLAGPRAGIVAGAAAIANPVLWHASEIAYPYAVLALLAGAVALALIVARTARGFVLATAALGIASGARQDLLVLLGPLWLAVATARPRRVVLLGAVAGALAALVWIVPSAVSAGGLDRYIALVTSQALGSSELAERSAPALARNVSLTASGLYAQLQWLWPIAGLGFWWLARRAGTRREAWLIAIALIPALVVFLFFHIGEYGYTLALAVPLAALVGVGAEALLRAMPTRYLVPAGAALIAAVTILGATFLVGDRRFSAQAIRRHDLIVREQVSYIRSRFDPAETVLLARANYWHARYYLPEYGAVLLPEGFQPGGKRTVRALTDARFAVFMDDQWLRFQRVPKMFVRLPDDVDLVFIRLGPRDVLTVEGEELDVVGQ